MLEIVNAAGDPVHLPPPPIPGGESPIRELAPGENFVVWMDGFLPEWVPAGKYRTRLSYVFRPIDSMGQTWTGELVSGWAEFQVID